jgi:hypothetical protein
VFQNIVLKQSESLLEKCIIQRTIFRYEDIIIGVKVIETWLANMMMPATCVIRVGLY